MNHQNIIVVTVTYKNRFLYIRRLIDSCLLQGVYKIIIVDNKSELESRKELEKINGSQNNKIIVKFLESNKGSAYGFKIGIKTALKDSNCDFILLLDDDNRPKNQSIKILLDYWEKIQIPDKNKRIMLAALRTGAMRKDQLKFLNKGSFLLSKSIKTQFNPLIGNNNGLNGLDLINNFSTLIKKSLLLTKKTEETKAGLAPINPYGGSFFHKELIKIIGLPDPKYFVYGDDWDYSYRVIKNNGKIIVLKNPEIEDMEISWWGKSDEQLYNVPSPLMGLVKMVKTQENGKYSLYYSIRNIIIFQKENIITNYPRFLLNLLAYTVFWFILTLAYRNPKNIRIYLYSITDGLIKNFNRKL